MTITHPHSSKIFLNRMIILLIAALLLCTIWLIVAYNQLVNLKHGVADANIELKHIETQGAELKNSLFALISNEQLGEFATSRNLSLDQNPYYLTVNSPWSLALQ